MCLSVVSIECLLLFTPKKVTCAMLALGLSLFVLQICCPHPSRVVDLAMFMVGRLIVVVIAGVGSFWIVVLLQAWLVW